MGRASVFLFQILLNYICFRKLPFSFFKPVSSNSNRPLKTLTNEERAGKKRPRKENDSNVLNSSRGKKKKKKKKKQRKKLWCEFKWDMLTI